MRSTINPFKWLTYTRMILRSERKVRKKLGGINLFNIDLAASKTLELLAREAIARNISVHEFAYILYRLSNTTVAYHGVFAVEFMNGRLDALEREMLADETAYMHYEQARQ